MNPQPKKRCAIYTRKSTHEGLEQDFNTLKAQREAGLSYIESQKHEGWIAVDTLYDDGGFSGGSLERPALQRLMDDLRAGRIDVIVCYKIDRLTRSLTDFAKIVDVFDAHSVSFVSVTQHFNTKDSMGRLTLNILLSFAQFEREVSAERVRDKFAASRKKGLWMGGNPPLGYDVVDRKLIVNPAEAKLVGQIFKRYLTLNSHVAVARELNQAGHTMKSWMTLTGNFHQGGEFDKKAIARIVNNPVYIGIAAHKGKHHKGVHEPIIDKKLWDKCKEQQLVPYETRRRKAASKTPCFLQGLIYAPSGHLMSPSFTRDRRNPNKLYRYYVDQSAIKKGWSSTTLPSVPAGIVEKAVMDNLLGLFQCPEICRLVHQRVELEDPGTRLEQVKDALGAFSSLWEELFPAEQKRIMSLLLKRVDMTPNSMTILIDVAGFEPLFADLNGHKFDDANPVDTEPTWVLSDDGTEISMTVEVAFKTRSGRKTIIVPKDDEDPLAILNPEKPVNIDLIRLIAQAHRWKQMMLKGLSYVEIAKLDGFSTSHIARVLTACSLSPNHVTSILNGTQPAGMTVTAITRGMSPLWEEQVFPE